MSVNEEVDTFVALDGNRYPVNEEQTPLANGLNPRDSAPQQGIQPTRVLHVHTDHCSHDCAEVYERTDLEKDNEKGVLWQSEIVAVHRIGEYAFTEYADRDFSSGPNYGKPTGEMSFSGYINERSISRSWNSLDEALVGVIAYKRDGCNSQAAKFFMRATKPDNSE